MTDLKIAVGISDFEKIRSNGFYYVDKSGLIAELLKNSFAEVTLITRPRRFGKTLAMSMLASFFDIRRQSRAYFEGLDIMNNPELCAAWMNQYPALFLTFKDVDGLDYASAKQMLRTQIAGLYGEHAYLKTSSNISENDRKVYEQLADVVDGAPTDAMLKTSIAALMRITESRLSCCWMNTMFRWQRQAATAITVKCWK